MHLILRTRGALLALLTLAGGATACAVDDRGTGELGSDWEYLGKAPLAEAGEQDGTPSGPPPLAVDELEDAAYLVLEDGSMYRSEAPSVVPDGLDFGGVPADADLDLLRQLAAADAKGADSGVMLGEDDRHVITNDDTLQGYPYRTVGAIVSGANGQYPRCTGTMIGPRHVLTAAHCLYGNDGWYSNLYFSPGQRGSVRNNGEPRRMVARYARKRTLSFDYGLMILEDEPRTASLGWMGYWYRSDLDDYDELSVRNNGYPGWTQQCAASPRSDGQCGGMMYGDYCRVKRATDGYVMYDCDATGGQSGSAVWRYWNGVPVIVGVHKRGNEPDSGAVITSKPATLNAGPRMRSKLYGDVCTWIGNFPSVHASHPCQ